MVAALLAVLARPSSWAIALAGFLARGGLLLLLLPVVVIPTTSGFANVVAPTLIPFVFGQDSPAFASLVAVVSISLLGWLILAGLFGAWTDEALIREAAEDEELGIDLPLRRGLIWRSLAVRFIAHIPFLVALGWGAMRIVEAGYRELVMPEDMATPLVVRVIITVPDVVLVMASAWMAGEAIGGLAQRRLLLARVTVARALVQALVQVIRRPLTSLATAFVTNAVVLITVVPAALAASVVWSRLAVALAVADRAGIAVALLGFVAVWMVGLLLAGVTTAWRGYAWTFEAYRHAGIARRVRDRPAQTPGTIGPGRPVPPGGWSPTDPSGSL
jgi:hypothetical protein